jgi:hypothetical protein
VSEPDAEGRPSEATRRGASARTPSELPEGAGSGVSPRPRSRAVSYGTLCGLAALVLMLWLLCSPQG